MPQHLDLLSPPDLVRPQASLCLSIKERLSSVLVCFVIIRQASVGFQNFAVRISDDLRFEYGRKSATIKKPTLGSPRDT
jgi:hypothetical protein